MAIIFLLRRICQSTNPCPVLKVQSSSSSTVVEATPSSFLLRGGTNSILLYAVIALASLHCTPPTNRVTFFPGLRSIRIELLRPSPFINAGGNVLRPGMILLIPFAACLMPTAYRSLASGHLYRLGILPAFIMAPRSGRRQLISVQILQRFGSVCVTSC